MQHLNEIFRVEEDWNLEQLNVELGIRIKSYNRSTGHKFHVLNYNQIESPKNHPIADQCRGLILWEVDGLFKVVCRPFKRFYNYGECPEAQEHIDWDRSTVVEKVDGSLIKIWYDHVDKRWEIATRGTAFGEAETKLGKEYRELAIEAMCGIDSEEEFQSKAEILDPECTYLFELIGPENRIVTPYKQNELVFLAVVDNFTGNVGTVPCTMFNKLYGRSAKVFRLNNADDVIEASKNIKNLEEGFVVYDQFDKPVCKIKSPLYVSAHHIRGEGLSRKRIIDLLLTNEIDEYLTYYPEDTKVIDPYRQSYYRLLVEIGETWDKIEPMVAKGVDRKKIAMQVKDLPYSMLIFRAMDQNLHPIDIWHQQDYHSQHRLVDKFI